MVDRFPVVPRGYDKEKVDAAFDATQESMKRAQQTLASMREQIAADDDRILQLQAQLQEEKNKKPEGNSFASLGANAQQMLASAEQTSTELLERAKQDASSIRTTALNYKSVAKNQQTFHIQLCGSSISPSWMPSILLTTPMPRPPRF